MKEEVYLVLSSQEWNTVYVDGVYTNLENVKEIDINKDLVIFSRTIVINGKKTNVYKNIHTNLEMECYNTPYGDNPQTNFVEIFKLNE